MAQREQDEGADESELRLQRRLMQDIGDTRAEIESLRRELSSSPSPDGAGASSPTTCGDGTPQLEPEPESPQLTRTLTEAVFDRLCATPLLTASLPACMPVCLRLMVYPRAYERRLEHPTLSTAELANLSELQQRREAAKEAESQSRVRVAAAAIEVDDEEEEGAGTGLLWDAGAGGGGGRIGAGDGDGSGGDIVPQGAVGGGVPRTW
eukprot:COSAG01_NODE_12260_length_1772_cov_1.733413_1_plen_208_part_00